VRTRANRRRLTQIREATQAITVVTWLDTNTEEEELEESELSPSSMMRAKLVRWLH